MKSTQNLFDAGVRLGRSQDHITGAPATGEALVAVMEEVGIREALVWHADAQFYDTQAGNGILLEEIADYPNLHPCWVFMPHETGEMPPSQSTVTAMLKAGVKAARIFPRQHLFMFRLWNLEPLLQALATHAIPLFVDFGIKSWGDVIDWDGLYEVGKAYPELPLILPSINIGSDRLLIPLMKRLPNLYVETSYYTVHRGIELLDATIGAERVLFGSGLPLRAPGPALTALSYSLINEDKKKLVAGDNLRRLMNEVRL